MSVFNTATHLIAIEMPKCFKAWKNQKTLESAFLKGQLSRNPKSKPPFSDIYVTFTLAGHIYVGGG